MREILRRITRTVFLGMRLEKESWSPTRGQMKLLARHYGFRAVVTQSTIYGKFQAWIPIKRPIGGTFSPEQRIIKANNHRSFWHELGHVRIYLWLGKWPYQVLRNMLSVQFPAVIVLAILGILAPIWVAYSFVLATLCCALNEFLANWVGIRLSRHWRGRI